MQFVIELVHSLTHCLKLLLNNPSQSSHRGCRTFSHEQALLQERDQMSTEDHKSHLLRDDERFKHYINESQKCIKLEYLRLQDEARELQCIREH